VYSWRTRYGISWLTDSDNKDACNYSPARAENAVTVGASTLGDERAYFSNHGKCVDIFAPGLNILSTWNAGERSTNTISGTSMASPHICGLLAYLLSLADVEGSVLYNEQNASAENVVVKQEDVSAYAKAYGLLPEVMQNVLPTPADLADGVATRPTPPKKGKVTPAQLKKALIKLSSSGLLKDLPAQTVNLLAYNDIDGKHKF
jgi:cerevisin